MRRLVAANKILIGGKCEVRLGVVEIEGRDVVGVNRLHGEQPFTEWLGGTIQISTAQGGERHAFKDGIMLIA